MHSIHLRTRHMVRFILITLFLMIPANVAEQNRQAQTARQSSRAEQSEKGDSISRPTSEPYNGDLSIFEDEKRGERLQINRVMDLLNIKEGSSVADIGAGSGWFTVRAAARVGPLGAVFAVEINPEYIAYIRERASREGFANIRTVLGKEDDPMLAPLSVDAVLMLKTYHEIAEPIRLLAKLRAAMRPGALLGIIDRDGDGGDHGIDSSTVMKEAARAGFEKVEQYDFVKPDGMDYFLILRARRDWRD
jgi:SAM-dependent methyltransferase